MSYEKQTWATGDIISAEKMNHIENGIESASSGSNNIIIAHITPISLTEGECDLSPQDIALYIKKGYIVYFELLDWLTAPAHNESTDAMVIIKASGFAINPMNNNSLDLCEINYRYKMSDFTMALTFNLTTYATPQS